MDKQQTLVTIDEKQEILGRQQIKQEDKWRIEDLFEDDKQWSHAFADIEHRCREFKAYEGTLGKSSKDFLEVLQKYFLLEEKFEAVYVYAQQKSHEDTGNSKYQNMSGQAATLSVVLNESVSFIEPEILKLPEATIKKYFEENQELHLYDRYVWEKLRQKKHILSKEMELVLAKVQKLAQGPGTIFTMFNNADIEFGKVTDAKGDEKLLTHGRYVSFLESQDRCLRENGFRAMYAPYEKYKNTLAATMDANVKQQNFFANMRRYDSSLEAALDQGNIPVSVYEQLIKAVSEQLSQMYEYVEFRKQVLGVSELHMYDLYVPMVAGVHQTYSFEEAKEIVKDGLKVLGEEYISILEEGFNNSWIDIYENKGKRSGAYSWGAYGTHPFVLLNFNGSLNHVFTLAHEMGHAIHSYLSDATQPYPYAGYKIFVAEVASTCNEALLIHHLIEKSTDKKEKAYLINYFLDQFKGTLFRQTMFADFEKTIHSMANQGETLTAEKLCDIYYELNKSYYGDGIVVDPDIAMEWARIPHFYNPFYVYQYATGFSAAIAISKKILAREEGILQKYRQFLSGGSSKDPLDLLRICGVDMTTKQPVADALAVFHEYLKQLKNLI